MKWPKDPGGVFRRRALRVAVVLPLIFYFVQYVLDLTYGSGIASFTAYALLGLADFGGPRASRAKAYIITGLVGTPLMIIGSLLSGSTVLSILTAGVVAFIVNYSGVLRGYFAAASVALLLPFVMAVTSPPGTQVMLELCAGFLMGVAASLVAALVLWPTYLRSNLRQATAAALEAVADEIALRWQHGGSPDDIAAARAQSSAAIRRTRSLFDGALVRPGPGTGRDRSLVAVISELDRVNHVLEWQAESSPRVDPLNVNLAAAVVTTLRDAAGALNGSATQPDPATVNRTREAHELLIEARVAELPTGPAMPLAQVTDLMPLRIVALSAQSIAGNAVRAVGLELPEGATAVTLGGQRLWDPTDRLGPIHYLISEFKWKSPWVRNAIRTGAAIAIATAIVQITDIPHGMWIVLGTLVALRFDAGGTSRTAVAVILGTVAGFVLGAGTIYLIGGNEVALWVVLPFLVFLACYTPNSISLAVGQATFTIYGIVLYAIYVPSGYSTAAFRLIDVLIAMLVSLAVSALLWPRGVVTLVESSLASSAAGAGDFLVAAMAVLTRTAGADPDELAQQQVQARRTVTVSKQSYDLAYAQKGPGLPEVGVWAKSSEAIANVERTAEIVYSVVRHGRTSGGNSSTRQALLETTRSIDAALESAFGPSAADRTDSGANDASAPRLRQSVTDLSETVSAYIREQVSEAAAVDPKDLAALMWLTDWLQYAAWEVKHSRDQLAVPSA